MTRIDLDDVTLAFKISLPETPQPLRIIAEAEARGVESLRAKLQFLVMTSFLTALAKGFPLAADDFAKQLRRGPKK
ncbi:hypothetical protein LNP74_19695 [Klebsiella pneumoniae subsp. pneumoniae]|nr:hypothetical protein [Klebsiella pneumoniae subsp. pneumoniae]